MCTPTLVREVMTQRSLSFNVPYIKRRTCTMNHMFAHKFICGFWSRLECVNATVWLAQFSIALKISQATVVNRLCGNAILGEETTKPREKRFLWFLPSVTMSLHPSLPCAAWTHPFVTIIPSCLLKLRQNRLSLQAIPTCRMWKCQFRSRLHMSREVLSTKCPPVCYELIFIHASHCECAR